MSEVLKVKKREDRGSRASNRLRCEGRCPAVLYGHNEPAVSLSLASDELSATLRHGAKIVQLAGDLDEQALLQSLQWDTFGRNVLHVDLLRVAKGEKIKVEIEVVGKGDAPGENDGGILTWINHSVEIEVIPSKVPEKLHVSLSELQIGGTLTASDIFDLPEGAELVTAPERVIVNCVPPAAEPDEAEGAEAPTGAEPEVIGKKEGDEEASDES